MGGGGEGAEACGRGAECRRTRGCGRRCVRAYSKDADEREPRGRKTLWSSVARHVPRSVAERGSANRKTKKSRRYLNEKRETGKSRERGLELNERLYSYTSIYYYSKHFLRDLASKCFFIVRHDATRRASTEICLENTKRASCSQLTEKGRKCVENFFNIFADGKRRL